MAKTHSGTKTAEGSVDKSAPEIPEEILEAVGKDKVGTFELLGALHVPRSNEIYGPEDAFTAALHRVSDLKPTDAAEKMLAAQMVGVHAAAMHCLQAAAIPGQTFHAVDMRLKHATKLLGLFTRQMEALDKHRGKGQQKVTVEYVNVESGGQAVVGHVETRRSGRKGGGQKRHSSPKRANTEQAVPLELNARESAPVVVGGDNHDKG